MSPIIQYIIAGVASIALGYILFLTILKLLPKKLKHENLSQKSEVLKEANRQRKSILKNSSKRLDETLQLMSEELDEDIQSRKEELSEEELSFEERQSFINEEVERIKKIEADVEKKSKASEALEEEKKLSIESIENSKQQLIEKLEEAAKENSITIKERLKSNLIESRQLESQKLLKQIFSDLDSTAKRKAQRLLDRAQARYAPNFYWPKAINSVEVLDRNLAEKLADENCQLIKDMKEISEVDIQIILPKPEDRNQPSIKLAGGFGIHKEAAKLALTQLVKKGPNSWNNAKLLFKQHNATLENQALELGKKAVNELKLDNIHPEIQRLIGALNWRTSYRQNQWFHTVEVARLAGIVGSEIGLNPDDAKRVGLLHDIGKAIDYRIEGSHAVISGDYADRFGENKIICDTVMSHHSDIIVETPLAYILRVADTLSGARPGARVNLEEGYQIRLSAIADAVRSFQGISDLAIMNGGREIHIQVNNKKVKEHQLKELTEAIARKIEVDVAFPGQIKVMVSRQFESVTVA